MQILHELKPSDRTKCKAFALEMLIRIEDDEDSLKKVMFTEEACFYVLGKVSQHKVRIWGSENPHVVIEHTHDCLKVNVYGVAFSMTAWWVCFSLQRIQ